MIPDSWPRPDTHAAAISERLSASIRREIDANGGWLAFDRYMELALYAPALGYYSAGSVKLGPAGDFVTAPEVSEIFGRVLAAQLAPVLERLDDPVVFELGAGTGRLAKTLLDSWTATDAALREYWILEPSAELKQRQARCLDTYADRVRWLEDMPNRRFEGIVIANEVADALPVSVFVKRGTNVRPLGVIWTGNGFAWAEGGLDDRLVSAVAGLEDALGAALPDGYRSELCGRLPAWIARIAEPLARGAVVLVDYGLARREYYHPSRSAGTLVCHYRHRAHGDPFLLPGLQDISAWVDFSACADAASDSGLSITGYTTQAQFLLHGGAAELIERFPEPERLRQSQAFKTLILPGEMGERFKLLLMTRDLDMELPGRDFRDRL